MKNDALMHKFSTDEDRKVTFDDIKETLKYIKSRKAD